MKQDATKSQCFGELEAGDKFTADYSGRTVLFEKVDEASARVRCDPDHVVPVVVIYMGSLQLVTRQWLA